MAIKPRFIRELYPYSKEQLKGIFNTTEEKTVSLIKKLKEYNVLKQQPRGVSSDDLSELASDEIFDVVEDGDTTCFVFTFVGVLCVNGVILMCYPKYITDAEPINQLNQIIKVIRKYNAKEEIIHMYNGDDKKASFNMLAIMLYLMNDYYDNGIYNNYMQIVEDNGMGEILWDKTINETFAIIQNNRPYYTTLKTHKTIVNDYDFFKRLHVAVLVQISKELKNGSLLEIFEFDDECVYLSDETVDDLGDVDYLLYRIEQELNVQFNTHKQIVLKTIYAYLSSGKSLEDVDSFSLFGTNSFHVVWEVVCAEVFDNKLQTKLSNLKLPSGNLSEYYSKLSNRKLLDIIEKPKWISYIDGNKNNQSNEFEVDTYIPDIVAIEDDKFFVFDAKYYTIQLNEYGVNKQPPLESITKQYVYQLVYKRFIEEHGFTTIRNCFLFPTENEKVFANGLVKIDIFKNLLNAEDIEARLLPATKMYDLYLSGRQMSVSELNL